MLRRQGHVKEALKIITSLKRELQDGGLSRDDEPVASYLLIELLVAELYTDIHFGDQNVGMPLSRYREHVAGEAHPRDFLPKDVETPFRSMQSTKIHYSLETCLFRRALALLLDARKMACREVVKLVNSPSCFALGIDFCAKIDTAIGHMYLSLGGHLDAEHSFSLATKWTYLGRSVVLCRFHRDKLRWRSQFLSQVTCLVDLSKGALCRNLLNTLNCIISDVRLRPDSIQATSSVQLRGINDAVGTSLSTVVGMTNNLALNSLFHCQIDRAVALLEAAINFDPSTYMTDAVVFNLCTMYDLSFDSDAAVGRKMALQRKCTEFRMVDVRAASFRVVR